jgi:hypothetical protein
MIAASSATTLRYIISSGISVVVRKWAVGRQVGVIASCIEYSLAAVSKAEVVSANISLGIAVCFAFCIARSISCAISTVITSSVTRGVPAVISGRVTNGIAGTYSD